MPERPPTFVPTLSLPERIAQHDLLLAQVSKELTDISTRLHLGSDTMAKVNAGQTGLIERVESIETAIQPQPFWKTLVPFSAILLAIVAGIVYISKLPTRDEYSDVRAATVEAQHSLESEISTIKIEQARTSGDLRAIRDLLDRNELQQQKIDGKLDRLSGSSRRTRD